MKLLKLFIGCNRRDLETIGRISDYPAVRKLQNGPAVPSLSAPREFMIFWKYRNVTPHLLIRPGANSRITNAE